MTQSQEDALYDFLDNETGPFTLEHAAASIKTNSQKTGRLAKEIRSLINARNIAFSMDTNQWISRRGCFANVPFVISPTRMELANGILIPGHRCLPFANPQLFPQEYVFYWNGNPIPVTAVEGEPEEFYPYYALFGEEFAPQYVARDNPANESAYNQDPYEDPPEVSVHTLDMRNIYRETFFVPGDRFVVRTRDWKAGAFELFKTGKDDWADAGLLEWAACAEKGFARSFQTIGPGSSTEEQILFAYWYGGERMRDIPAYALEEYLYEKTEHIETTAYGIESRFWYAGKEIPDRLFLEDPASITGRTGIEELLHNAGVPISEYVIQSYIRDALYRNDLSRSSIIGRILPPAAGADEHTRACLSKYISHALDTFKPGYSPFTGQAAGPVRQRAAELHTAVIELILRLQKGTIKPSCLPKHTFVVLSQIQNHSAILLEDLDMEESPPAAELETLDNSLDSMIETYEDMKELIDDALRNFRRQGLSVVKARDPAASGSPPGYSIQISLGGTEIWRRIIVPGLVSLKTLRCITGVLFGWKDAEADPPDCRFTLVNGAQDGGPEPLLEWEDTVEDLNSRRIQELRYEQPGKWVVKLLLLSCQDADAAGAGAVRCVAGAGASPPDFITGPLQLKRYIDSLNWTEKLDRYADPKGFDLNACNRELASRF
ncbi:MAG: plasmid pRiA4b ORF-3 family protein [Treponema sp.]|jgi:hypothetical protein|nr:plasmid pRiA4b ORF-3 family protein [Treponema sp.]